MSAEPEFTEVLVKLRFEMAPILGRIEELERQRDNLQRCNNEYLERARTAEATVERMTRAGFTSYISGDLRLVHGDGF